MKENEQRIVDETKSLLECHGIGIFELVALMGKRKSELLQLKSTDYNKFSKLYEQIRNEKCSKTKKGALLEQLVYLFFREGYSNIWECRKNKRTSTNEIDLQLNWTENARLAQLHIAFSCFGESFLCECKNYGCVANVTYVGKFYSLLKVSNAQMGIFISWKGISGRGAWSDAKGLIKKIALKENIFIIVLDGEDIKKIYEKKCNIFSLVYDKYIALKNDIDYSSFIQKHENEKDFF